MGAPRLHAELRLAGGVKVGKKRVARLMRELEIDGVSRRRGRVRTTTPDKQARPAPDLVRRDFRAERPDQTGVADILRRECLDRLLIFGRRHLEGVAGAYAQHYNEHRPHRSLAQIDIDSFGLP